MYKSAKAFNRGKTSEPFCYYVDDTLRLNKSLVRQEIEMNVLTLKPLVSINDVPPRSESIRRMYFKPFLVIGKPIIRSRQPHRPIWHVRKLHIGWSMCSCLALYNVVESLRGRNVCMGGKMGVMSIVVVTTLMETAVEVGNSP